MKRNEEKRGNRRIGRNIPGGSVGYEGNEEEDRKGNMRRKGERLEDYDG